MCNDKKINMDLQVQRISKAVVNSLDAQVASIDHTTARRLTLVRSEALAQGQRKQRFVPMGPGWSAVLASVASFLVIMMFWNTPVPETSSGIVATNSGATLEHLPIMSSSDDLEFYQSVDFLLWMEKNAG